MIYLVIVVLIRFILFCNLLNLFTDGKNPYYSCLCEFVYVLRAYIQIVRCSLLRFYFALMLKSDEFKLFFLHETLTYFLRLDCILYQYCSLFWSSSEKSNRLSLLISYVLKMYNQTSFSKAFPRLRCKAALETSKSDFAFLSISISMTM